MTSKETTEESIMVAACIKGDKAAQYQFYQRFSPVLFAICKRYADDEDSAKDMFQEAMIKIFQKLTDFRFEGSLEGWLKRVCVNQCLDSLKKSKAKFNESLNDAHSNLPSDSDIFSEINVKNLMQLLGKLPVGYRTVFNLFAIEGYSHAEIASMLNITENTSKSQMFKARKWLQNQIVK
jgi:RNA polymerase sigma-70 factor (ECF subfamily)